ncbi:MAG: acyl-phosphate glycerol 3-phosphate acyltransferase [Arcobacter sp.]|nr:MAG: acyl-phosphate glycerol 3-phosphate acyltransferase [Arcobacter sp.]
MDIFIISILILFAYLLGSISAAILTCKLMGLPDPREEGSHNPGASNVLALGGEKAAAITLFGDALKGLVPVLIGLYLGLNELSLSLIAFASFMGHLYPVFFKFEGGKGVATAFGIFIGLNWQVAFCVLVTWLIIIKIFKLSALGALLTALLAPLYFYLLDGSFYFTSLSLVLSLLLIYRHLSNIINIINGTED